MTSRDGSFAAYPDASVDTVVADTGSNRNVAMIAFVTISLLVSMSVGQMEGFERGSLQYWLTVLPALLFPLHDLRAIVETLLGRARLLLWFLLWAGVWHFFQGDARTTMQICALVLGVAWISTDRAQIRVEDLTRLYLALVVVGLMILLFSGFNQYAVVPGFTDPEFGIWRISFFPNVAYTGALSLVVILVLTRTRDGIRQHPLVFAIASYFLVLSFVRSALVAVLIYALLYRYFCRDQDARPRRMFWIALVVAFGLPIAAFWSAGLLYVLQDNPLISVFFLRGKTGLSIDDILYQLYRPWLWVTHFQLFFSSPAWMGWGSLYQSALDATGPPQATIGSESLPTRLLANYGLPGIFFTLYLVGLLREAARAGDRWACACFPAVFFLLTNWGSLFHSTDAMFVLLLLTIARGTKGYTSTEGGGASEADARSGRPVLADAGQ